MEHIWFLILNILTCPVSLLGAWLLERASRRYLAVKPGKIVCLIRLALFRGGMSGPMWIGDENLLFYLPAFLGIFMLFYQGAHSARAVVGVTFYLLLAGIGTIWDSTLGFRVVGAWDWSETLIFCLKVLAAGLVCLLSRKLNSKGDPLELPGRLWGLCGLLSLAPLATVLSFSLWNSFGRDSMDAGQYRIAYTVLPFVFFSALALLVAMAVLSRHEELEQAAKLAQMRELYYMGLQRKEMQVRTLRHDLRYHLSAVQGLLAQGETERAQEYLAMLTASPALHGTKRICVNELANVVLTGKFEEMERCGLTLDALVTLPKELPVADIDLCALLGNALDHAIEAAKGAESKTIVLCSRSDRGMLMLRIENGCAQASTEENGRLVTSKTDCEQHGFVIRGMREIDTRYGGTLETRYTNHCFELVACLPITERWSFKIPCRWVICRAIIQSEHSTPTEDAGLNARFVPMEEERLGITRAATIAACAAPCAPVRAGGTDGLERTGRDCHLSENHSASRRRSTTVCFATP